MQQSRAMKRDWNWIRATNKCKRACANVNARSNNRQASLSAALVFLFNSIFISYFSFFILSDSVRNLLRPAMQRLRTHPKFAARMKDPNFVSKLEQSLVRWPPFVFPVWFLFVPSFCNLHKSFLSVLFPGSPSSCLLLFMFAFASAVKSIFAVRWPRNNERVERNVSIWVYVLTISFLTLVVPVPVSYLVRLSFLNFLLPSFNCGSFCVLLSW